MPSPDLLDRLQTADEITLVELIERANALLAQRQQSRRRDVLEKAASELAAAGISADEFTKFLRSRSKPKKAPSGEPKTTKHRYVNPAEPDQTYELGRGRPPKWFTDLKRSGQLPEPESRSVR